MPVFMVYGCIIEEYIEQVDQRIDQVDHQFSRHEARLLSLENWMRATFVTLALVVVG